MKKIRLTALLLAVVMLLGILAGCGKKENEQDEVTYIFEPTYYKLDGKFQGTNGAPYLDKENKRIYFIAYVNDGMVTETDPEGNSYQYEKTVQKLLSVNFDGTDMKPLDAFKPTELPEGSEGSSNISAMAIAPDGSFWVAEAINSYHYELPEDFNPETDEQWNYYVDDGQRTLLRKLGPDGTELASVDMRQLLQERYPDNAEAYQYYYINNFCFDNDSNLYLGNGDTGIFVLDPEGKVIAEISGDNFGGQVVRLGDGRVATMSWDETGGKLSVLDLATKSVTEKLPLPYSWNNLYDGDENYLYYYNTSTSLMGYKADGTTEKLLDWLNSDIDQSNISGFSVFSPEQVITMENDWENQEINLIVLNKIEVTPENRRTSISMAVMWLDWDMRKAVLDFNRTNKEYRIEVKDYSEYNTEEDYNAGMKKLSTEIISGNVPDLLFTDGMPISLYGAKGLLEDLMPYIEKDTELGGTDALVMPVIEAMKQNGKLYYVAKDFSIQTAVASRRIVGDITGWTVDEMKEALSRLPEGASVLAPYYSQDQLLRMLCIWNMDEFINWETGECTFDNGDFAKLLEFSAMAPKTVPDDIWEDMKDDATMYREGRQLLFPTGFSDVWDYFYQKSTFGDDLVYVGYPTADRQGNLFSVNNGLAMSSKCKSKDAAWQFIRKLLLPRDDVWQFSINKANFQKLIDEAKREETWTNEDGTVERYPKYTYYNENGEEINVYAMTDEDEATIMDLINNTTKVQNYDENMLNIIMDAAAPFLNGEKSAEQTASEVQNRVKLYVNEQR